MRNTIHGQDVPHPRVVRHSTTRAHRRTASPRAPAPTAPSVDARARIARLHVARDARSCRVPRANTMMPTAERASLLPHAAPGAGAIAADDDGTVVASRRVSVRAAIVSALALGAVAACAVALGGVREDPRAALSPPGAVFDRDAARLAGETSWHDVVYDISCAHADYRNEHDATTISEADRETLAGVTYVSGFWRLRGSHRDPQKYIDGLKETPCETAGFAMNVVFVEDSAKMCRYVMKLYAAGAKDQGEYKYGAGRATCVVMRQSAWSIQPTKCDSDVYGVWFNKAMVLSEVARQIDAGEISSEFKAQHYFWMDGDIAHGVIGKIGRFPRLMPVLHAIRDEGSEDKLMVLCYANESERHDAWSHAAVGERATLGAHDVSPLGLPTPVPRRCPWMRHEVIANVFGGSRDAVDRFAKAWPEYIDNHVPTKSNRGVPYDTTGATCACPSEELLMTSMANDGNFSHHFSSNTCARKLREPL